MGAHALHEFGHRQGEMAEGEVDEGVTDPAHRVERVHRALHDEGEVPPADAVGLGPLRLLHRNARATEIEYRTALDDAQRRLDRATDRAHQG